MHALLRRFVLEHGLHGHNFMITVRTTILNQLFVNLIGASQISAIHALVAVLETGLSLLIILNIE